MYTKRSITYGAIFIGVLMIVFYFTDLSISQSLFNIDSPFGKFFEAFGELPAVIVAMLSFAIIFFTIQSTGVKGTIFKVLTFIMLILSTFMATFMPLHYVVENFMGLALGLAIILLPITLFITSKVTRLPAERQLAYRKVANVGASLFIAAIVVINVIKLFWGRVRFREMYEPYDMFTSWIAPQLGTYQKLFEDPASFPSGHTGNAVLIIMITLLPLLFTWFRGKETILYLVSAIWIVLVALSRIVMGAHFASDVTIGAVLVVISFIVLCKVFKIDELENAQKRSSAEQTLEQAN